MEPAAIAWGSCGFQLPNWIPEEPAAGLPMEYASIDIPATWSLQLQAYLPEPRGVLQQQQQLVEYYNHYSAASQHNNVNNATGENKAMISTDNSSSDASGVVNQVTEEFSAHIKSTKDRMHRYPACLGSVDEAYTRPRIVAIGPYHHGSSMDDNLKRVEMVKHAAACHCVKQSGRSLEDLYGAVVGVADYVCWFYDKNVMAGIDPEDFRHLMFFDACFLVQFMLIWSDRDKDFEEEYESLREFLKTNRIDIFRDVMLLENQIPWIVVKTIMGFMPMLDIAKNFIRAKRHCMRPDDNIRDERPQPKNFDWDDYEYERYKPPHLLGLLRYFIVGRKTDNIKYTETTPKNIPASVSVIKLTEIGITVTANKTMDLIDMSLNQNLFPELSLPPLSLNRDRASYLVNMAAHELCTVKSFSRAKTARESALCSYLLLLAMLVYREEDVHELRVRGLLVGGGLSNKEALEFFKSFQGLRFGKFYNYVMVEIETYRENKRMQIKLYSFLHKNRNTIAVVVSGIVSLAGIIGTLLSIKKAV